MKKVVLALSLLMSFSAFGMEGDGARLPNQAPEEIRESVKEAEYQETRYLLGRMALHREMNERYGQPAQELNVVRAPQVNALDRNAYAKVGLMFGYTYLSKSIWSLIGLDSDLIPAASIVLLGLYLDGRFEFINRLCRRTK